MHKLRWAVLSILGWMLLLACSVETPPTPTVAPTAPPPTAEPTVAIAEPTEAPVAEAAPALQGVTLNGYDNVVFTEADADLLGKANRAQLLSVYATW